MTGWMDPNNAPSKGEFLARFRSERGVVRRVVLNRNVAVGTAAGFFEFDLGELTGWHPLPSGLSEPEESSE